MSLHAMKAKCHFAADGSPIPLNFVNQLHLLHPLVRKNGQFGLLIIELRATTDLLHEQVGRFVEVLIVDLLGNFFWFTDSVFGVVVVFCSE